MDRALRARALTFPDRTPRRAERSAKRAPDADGPEWYRFPWMWERRLREKLGEIATALGAEPPPLPPGLCTELRATPAAMPVCLGVDSAEPCTAR